MRNMLRRFTCFQYKETEVLDVEALNNTRRADRSVLFFNRVPKVGSQTFMELLRRLSMRNGFSFNRDRVQRVETIRLAPIEQVLKYYFWIIIIVIVTSNDRCENVEWKLHPVALLINNSFPASTCQNGQQLFRTIRLHKTRVFHEFHGVSTLKSYHKSHE